jgi:hypothetical protein
MLKKVLEEMLEDWEHWFALDKTTGSPLQSMLVVALAMVIELSFGIAVAILLVKLLK